MGGGGIENVEKMTPPFFGSRIMNLLVFFDFQPKKCFRVRTPWGLYGAEWDEHLMQFMHFFSHFWYVGGFGDLGDPVIGSLRGVSGDVVTVYAYYERTFFADSSLAESRSQPVPKTRND